MKIIYDFKTKDGEVYTECTFLHYMKNIRGGKHNTILTHASESVRIFNKDGDEVKDINLPNVLILKAYDTENNIDITDKLQYMSPEYLLEKVFID